MKPTKTCSRCHEIKPLDEFHNNKNTKDSKQSQCKKCRKEENKEYKKERREEISKYNSKYHQEHKDKKRKKAGYQSMYENKSCANYLGIVIGERLIRHLFKDVEVMPRGNPKFDFICNKGKKIDVKSASTTLTPSKYPRWQFNITLNAIADFFILVAFDNCTDLNPLYIWMIPGHEVNHQSKASISLSTIHKWDKWKRDISDAQLCCNEIKRGNI